MQVVLLLPSCNLKTHRIENICTEYIILIHFKALSVQFFVFKDFPIGLKENLREEDNLSTRDKWPVPNVSFVRRFYCSY